jgi:starch synthase
MEKYHEFFKIARKNYPRKVACFLTFDNQLAHRIEAGVDFFLMPSKYEPCGLNQMISLRYGTIPIVRATGGLADSVSDISSRENSGLGIVFRDYKSAALFKAIQRALDLYQDSQRRARVMKRAMQEDFSWQVAAQKYLQLYQRALQKA